MATTTTKMQERPIHPDFETARLRLRKVLVEDGNWTKKTFVRTMFGASNSRYCLLGALRYIQHADPNSEVRNQAEGDVAIAVATAICETPKYRERIDSGEWTMPPQNRATNRFMDGTIRHAGHIIMSFNDHDRTTAKELAEVIDKAADYDVIRYVYTPNLAWVWVLTQAERAIDAAGGFRG